MRRMVPKQINGCRAQRWLAFPRVRRATLGLLALIPAVSGCGLGEPADDSATPRILIVGIDGASPRVAFPMLEEGRLPNRAQIAAQGVSGPLRSVLPLYSPRIWNTIATGRPAKTHGIPVGPGRGSGAGSLVAYALTITNLDPLRFGLLLLTIVEPIFVACRLLLDLWMDIVQK